MRRALPLLVSCAATFLLVAYTTIVTVAMPAIAEDLQSGFGPLQWVIDVYTIALSALLVPLGAIGDRCGRRRLLVGGLVLFAVSSSACAAAPTVGALIAARGFQGAAAAAMFATSLPLLNDAYQGAARHRAFAIWGAVAGLAAAAGNVSGGVLSVLGWRVVFGVAVPLALVAAAFAVLAFPADARRHPVVGIDAIGMTLSATGIIAVIGVFLLLGEGESGVTAVVVAVVGIVCTVLLGSHLRRSPDPLMPPRLLRRPGFRAALIVAVVYYLACFGSLPALSAWMQGSLHASALTTSLLLSVQPVAFFLTSILCGARLARASRRTVFGLGLLLCGVGCASLPLAGVLPSWSGLLPALVLTGVGSGIISPILPAAAMREAGADEAGVASAAVNAARQVGLSLGVAVAALVVRGGASGGTVDGWTIGWTGMLAAGVCGAALLQVRRLLPVR